jgi:hypothetical protein
MHRSRIACARMSSSQEIHPVGMLRRAKIILPSIKAKVSFLAVNGICLVVNVAEMIVDAAANEL